MAFIPAYPPIVHHFIRNHPSIPRPGKPHKHGKNAQPTPISLSASDAHATLRRFLQLTAINAVYQPDSIITASGPQWSGSRGTSNLTLYHLKRICAGIEGVDLKADANPVVDFDDLSFEIDGNREGEIQSAKRKRGDAGGEDHIGIEAGKEELRGKKVKKRKTNGTGKDNCDEFRGLAERSSYQYASALLKEKTLLRETEHKRREPEAAADANAGWEDREKFELAQDHENNIDDDSSPGIEDTLLESHPQAVSRKDITAASTGNDRRDHNNDSVLKKTPRLQTTAPRSTKKILTSGPDSVNREKKASRHELSDQQQGYQLDERQGHVQSENESMINPSAVGLESKKKRRKKQEREGEVNKKVAGREAEKEEKEEHQKRKKKRREKEKKEESKKKKER